MIQSKYQDYIDKHYPTKESAVNQCAVAANNMSLYFWELKVQVGFVNEVEHCWLKDELGNIIDPTYRQFADNPNDIKYHWIADGFLNKDEGI